MGFVELMRKCAVIFVLPTNDKFSDEVLFHLLTQKIHTWSSKSQCMYYKWLFSTVCNSATITDNRNAYHTVITDFFVPAFYAIDINGFNSMVQFAHISHATIELLRQTFDDWLIRRNADVS